MYRLGPLVALVVAACGGEAAWTPLADAGADQVVAVGALASLDGGASWDPDGSPLRYAWSLVGAPAGSAALLSGADGATPTVQTDLPGTYTLQLVVEDESGLRSSPDLVSVVADPGNALPVAALSSSGVAAVGSTLQFDGSGSADPEGAALRYVWSLEVAPPASAASLVEGADPATALLIPDAVGTWVVGLAVDDGRDLSARVDLVLVVGETVNLAPLADCGGDQSWPAPGPVSLDGSLSSDPEGAGLGFSWSLAAVPAGSAARLVGADQRVATLETDLDGDYVVALVVDDGQLSSEPCAATVSIGDATANGAPVADAGADQVVDAPGLGVTLDGSASSDPDGDALRHAWELSSVPSGSALGTADLDASDPVRPRFTPDVAGNYQATLTVCDDGGLCDDDSVVVTVDGSTTTNTPPACDAGADLALTLGDTASLDGSGSSDADGDTLYFTWWFGSRPGDSAAALSGAYSQTPSFAPDVAGTYTVRLRVSDGADSCTDSVTVEVSEPASTNTPPTCDGGADQTVTLGDTVRLDGSASSDADGDSLNYTWWFGSRPTGAAASLDARFSSAPRFTPDVPGTWKVNLRVSDGADSCTDAVVVTVEGSLDAAPVADAGADQQHCLLAEAILDGSGSSDADGDALDYAWSLGFAPAGSVLETADIVGADGAAASFLPDVEGTYVFTLTVSDGTHSSSDEVSVTFDSDDTVLVLHFDEGSGTDLQDASPTGNDGAFLAGEWTDGAFLSTGGGFDGLLSEARVPHDRSLDLVEAGTVDFRMRTWTESPGPELVFTKGTYNYALYRDGSALVFYARTVEGAWLTLSAEAAGIGDGAWHHYALVIAESEVRLYEDGALIGSAPRTVELRPNAGMLSIGAATFLRRTFNLDADLDEFVVRDIALSGADVADRAAATAQVCPVDG